MYDLLTIGKSGAFGQENGFYKKTLAVFRCFFTRSIFLAKRSTFAYGMSYLF